MLSKWSNAGVVGEMCLESDILGENLKMMIVRYSVCYWEMLGECEIVEECETWRNV